MTLNDIQRDSPLINRVLRLPMNQKRDRVNSLIAKFARMTLRSGTGGTKLPPDKWSAHLLDVRKPVNPANSAIPAMVWCHAVETFVESLPTRSQIIFLGLMLERPMSEIATAVGTSSATLNRCLYGRRKETGGEDLNEALSNELHGTERTPGLYDLIYALSVKIGR